MKNLTKFTAGFHGKDAMREKAQKMLGDEIRNTDMRTPKSMSSPGRTNMRPFKKGGHAAPRSKVHKVSKEQSDLYIPEKKKSTPIKTLKFSSPECKSEGGKMGKDGKRKFGLGGALLGGLLSPLLAKIPKVGGALSTISGIGGGFLPFKKGGSTRKKTEKMMMDGGCHRKKKADGGAIVDSAPEPSLIVNAKKRWADSHPNGAVYAKGGKAKGRMKSVRRAEGGDMDSSEKFAMGGAGKIRKGQATKAGKPINKKNTVRRG